jgi:DnaJ-class molecular chaperone
MIKETYDHCKICKGYGGDIWSKECKQCAGTGIVIVRTGLPNGRVDVSAPAPYLR